MPGSLISTLWHSRKLQSLLATCSLPDTFHSSYPNSFSCLSHTAHTGLKPVMYPRMILNFGSSYLSLLSAQITVVNHHVHLVMTSNNYRKKTSQVFSQLTGSQGTFHNHEYKLRLTWSIFRKFKGLFPNTSLKAITGFAAPKTDSTQFFKSLLKKCHIN